MGKNFCRVKCNDRAYDCLEKEIKQLYRLVERGFAYMSDLVPEYIRNECKNVTQSDIIERFVNKAKNSIEYLQNDFPGFKADKRYTEIKQKYEDFIKTVQ
jgi:hypothetical protein